MFRYLRCCWIEPDLRPCGKIAAVVAIWQFLSMKEDAGALCGDHLGVYQQLEREGLGTIVTEVAEPIPVPRCWPPYTHPRLEPVDNFVCDHCKDPRPHIHSSPKPN